jgi:uncharacterized protein
MDMGKLGEPLAPAEIDELSDYFASTPAAKPLDWVHGLITAVASAPSMIAPSEWQPVVLGEPAFETMADAEHTLGLLLRFYNQVVASLKDEGAEVGPRDMDPAVVALWCDGYVAGTRLDPVWRADEQGVFLLVPFAVLSGQFDLTGEEDDKGEIIEDPSAHIEKYRANLPSYVRGIHDVWSDARRELVPTRTVRRAAKIGRNDPCPCGSGQKYKRCCALKLH